MDEAERGWARERELVEELVKSVEIEGDYSEGHGLDARLASVLRRYAALGAEVAKVRAGGAAERARLHAVIRRLVAAMREWGSWGDGVPANERPNGDVGAAYDAACSEIGEEA